MDGYTLAVAVAGAILSSSVIGVLINVWAQRHKPQLEKRQLDLIEMKDNSEAAHSVAEQLRRQNTDLIAQNAAWEVRIDTVQKEFDRQIRALILRVSDLEVAERENREWIRAAVPLMIQYVPSHQRLRPPSWFPVAWKHEDSKDGVE